MKPRYDSIRESEPAPLSTGQAARELGVSLDTVRRWEREGKIHAFRTPGGQRRFLASEVERVQLGNGRGVPA